MTPVNDIIERLRTGKHKCPSLEPTLSELPHSSKQWRELGIEAADVLEANDALIDHFLSALEPFAKFADKQDEYRRSDDDDFCATIVSGATGERWRLTCGDLRKARAALKLVRSSRP